MCEVLFSILILLLIDPNIDIFLVLLLLRFLFNIFQRKKDFVFLFFTWKYFLIETQ